MSMGMKPPLYHNPSKQYLTHHHHPLPDLQQEKLIDYDRSQAVSRGEIIYSRGRNMQSQLGVYDNAILLPPGA